MTLGSHERPQRGSTDVWLTPKPLIDLLGPFDLDPCSATNPPWPTARHHFTEVDDGLTQSWEPFGIVWLNPPYSAVWRWLERLASHPAGGVALIFARTETVGFHSQVFAMADAIAFPRGRITFCRADGTPGPGNAGAPSCFIAYGEDAANRLDRLQCPIMRNWQPAA